MIVRLRRFAPLLLVLAAMLLVILAVAAVDQIGFFLVVSDPLQRSDAVIVLDGFTPSRELEAAALYHRGLAPVVMVANPRDPIPAVARRLAGDVTPQEHAVRVLRHVGVPGDAIIRVTRVAENTDQELRADFDVASAHGFRRVILVTSPYHTRRVALIWRSRFGNRIAASVHPSSWEEFAAERWWRSRRTLEAAVHEVFGIFHFYVGAPLKTFDRDN